MPSAAGLLCGLTPWHVRVLADDPWVGGRGQRLGDVGDMTLDQCFLMLTDRDMLLNRQRSLPAEAARGLTREDGRMVGRDAEGNRIEGRVLGKSKARRLMEEAAARREAEAGKNRGRRERRNREKGR